MSRKVELTLLLLPLLAVALQASRGLNLKFALNPIQGIGKQVSSVKNLTEKVTDPIKGKVGDGIGTAKNIGKKLTEAAREAGNVLEGIGEDMLEDPLAVLKNVTDLVSKTAVFVRNNVTLNCLGLPIKAFANAIETIFTQTTRAEDVRFYFSSRKQPHYVAVRLDDDVVLWGTDFDVTRPTVVIVHGFMSSGREKWLREMKHVFLQLDDINTIVVDWQRGSNTWNYFSAAISTRIVGRQIAKLFAVIRETGNLSANAPKSLKQWGPIYFVGHSLGSHISAHASYLIRESQRNNSESWLVSRITGLDPAQPCFTSADPALKLDQTDAVYVDVIHTNAKHILFLGLGLPEQLGFVDFYPNGGQVQPGCSDVDSSFWSFILLPKNIIEETVCSHGRSHQFLTESVRNFVNGNCSFVGYKWDRETKNVGRALEQRCDEHKTCTEMGVNSANFYPNNPGIYYVPTKSISPFCASENNQDQSNEPATKEKPSTEGAISRLFKKFI